CLGGVGDGHTERPAPDEHRPSVAGVGPGWHVVVLRALVPAECVELEAVAGALLVGATDDDHTVIRSRFDVDALERDDGGAVRLPVDGRGPRRVVADAAQLA